MTLNINIDDDLSSSFLKAASLVSTANQSSTYYSFDDDAYSPLPPPDFPPQLPDHDVQQVISGSDIQQSTSSRRRSYPHNRNGIVSV